MVYEYQFTSFDEWRRTGNWWTRELKGAYFPPVRPEGRQCAIIMTYAHDNRTAG